MVARRATTPQTECAKAAITRARSVLAVSSSALAVRRVSISQPTTNANRVVQQVSSKATGAANRAPIHVRHAKIPTSAQAANQASLTSRQRSNASGTVQSESIIIRTSASSV